MVGCNLFGEADSGASRCAPTQRSRPSPVAPDLIRACPRRVARKLGPVEKVSFIVGVLKRRHREERKRRGDLIVYHQLYTTDEIAALPAVTRNDRLSGLFQQARSSGFQAADW